MYTLVGKQHIQGVSKTTQKPYNFNKLYFVVDPTEFNANSLEGQSVYECICDDECYLDSAVGSSYDKLFYDERRTLIALQ